jgi:hypothetical protein
MWNPQQAEKSGGLGVPGSNPGAPTIFRQSTAANLDKIEPLFPRRGRAGSARRRPPAAALWVRLRLERTCSCRRGPRPSRGRALRPVEKADTRQQWVGRGAGAVRENNVQKLTIPLLLLLLISSSSVAMAKPRSAAQRNANPVTAPPEDPQAAAMANARRLWPGRALCDFGGYRIIPCDVGGRP